MLTEQTYVLSKEEKQLKQEILDLFIRQLKERKSQASKISELLSNHITQNCHIYSTRNDIKSDVWIYEEGLYIPQGKTHINEVVRKLVGRGFTTQLANMVISKVEVDTYVNEVDFFNNNIKDEICCQNGIMQLKTRTLIPFDPTKIFFSKINATYDPKATCPTIDKHFETILKDKSDKKVLYELIGFCLYKEYFLEKGVMFLGNGRNGKGKTLEMIKRFLGAKNCSYQPLQKLGDDPYSRAYLFGKLANIVGDLGSKDINNSEAFKTLTGRDVITGQRKFMSNVEFTNHAKLMFACNNLPKTNDSSLAFFNRWLMFEFPYTFLSQAEINEIPKDERKNLRLQDPNWVDKLSSTEELNGLFNKALDGLERILTNKSFSNTQGINETKNLWIRKSDSVTAFFNEQLKTAEFEYRISKRIFKKEYSKFCRANRLRPLSDKAINHTLTDNEFGVSDFQDYKTGYSYWEGVAFKDGDITQNDLSENKTSFPKGYLEKNKDEGEQ